MIKNGTIILATAIILVAMELATGWRIGFLNLAIPSAAITIIVGTIAARMAYTRQNIYLQKSDTS